MFRRRSYGPPRRGFYSFAPRRSYPRPAASRGPSAYGYRARGYRSRSGYAARRLYIGGRRY